MASWWNTNPVGAGNENNYYENTDLYGEEDPIQVIESTEEAEDSTSEYDRDSSNSGMNHKDTKNASYTYYNQTRPVQGFTEATWQRQSQKERNAQSVASQHEKRKRAQGEGEAFYSGSSPDLVENQYYGGTTGATTKNASYGATNYGNVDMLSSKGFFEYGTNMDNNYDEQTNNYDYGGESDESGYYNTYAYLQQPQMQQMGTTTAGADGSNFTVSPVSTKDSRSPRSNNPLTTGNMPDVLGDQFYIIQKVSKRDIVENLVGVELGNKYTVKAMDYYDNQIGPNLYISEDSSWFQKCCCGPSRSLTFELFAGDNAKDNAYEGEFAGNHVFRRKHDAAPSSGKVLRMKKDFVCQCCCCPCLCTSFCKPRFDVQAVLPNYSTGRSSFKNIGHVQDHCKCCGTREMVYNQLGEHLYTVEGSECQLGACCPFGDAKYAIFDERTHARVGMLQKKGGGFKQILKEALADAQTFKVTPPDYAGPNEKALLLAAAMMVELQYYERTNDKREQYGVD